MTSSRVKRLAIDSMLLGAALVISYFESILPLSVLLPLPGAKLGLANVCIMFCFFKVSPSDAALVSFTRIFMTAFLFGSFNSFMFSLLGGFLAYLGMWIGKLLRNRVSFYGISVLSACMHNLGQCLCGRVILGNWSIFAYMPLLLVFSIIFGLITGAVFTPLLRLRMFRENA